MSDYSPRYQPKSNLKYLGINIPEGTKPDKIKPSEYNGNTIFLYDVTKFSPSQKQMTELKIDT